jgi:hypothetical protein
MSNDEARRNAEFGITKPELFGASSSFAVRYLRGSGVWFWIVITLGAAARLYLVIFTEGTSDVSIWGQHAIGVNNLGVVNYYHSNPTANHPPFMLELVLLLGKASQVLGIPFPIMLRAPFALLDAASAALLYSLLSFHRFRLLLVAAYWISPLSIILSAYQGNTDSAVAFFLLLSVWFLSKPKIAAAAIAIGLGLWVKVPGILAVPALAWYLTSWRRRALFLLGIGLVGIIGYLPALLQDAPVIAQNVFGYHGRLLQNPAGEPAWGPRVLFFSIIAAPDKWPVYLQEPVVFFLRHSWQIAVSCSLALGLLWQLHRSIPNLCATIAVLYFPVYGLTDNWAFQYFAWSLPFWFFLPLWFSIPAVILSSGYIYSLYWALCHDPFLRGNWDFGGVLVWPGSVIVFRDLAVLFFSLSACGFLVTAIWRQASTIWTDGNKSTDPSRP